MDAGMTTRRSVAAEILVPVVVYFAVSRLWHSQLAGLIASGGSAAVLALIPVLRRREFRTLPVVMAIAAVAGLAVSAISGSARMLLVREAYLGFPLGLVFIVSACTSDPALNRVLQALLGSGPDHSARWARALADRGFRRRLATVTGIWGVVGILGSAAQVVGAYALPVDSAVLATSAVGPAVIVAASIATAPVISRIRRHLAAATPTVPTVPATPADHPDQPNPSDEPAHAQSLNG
jgi:hypothetical protein